MTYSFPTQEQFIVELPAEQSRAVLAFVEKHAFNPYTSDLDLERFIDCAFMIVRILPDDLISRILAFRRHGNDDGVLIIRGFPIEQDMIGKTPEHWLTARETKQSYATEMYLIGIASLIGEVFAFSTQHAGNIVQNVLPTKSDMYEQVGTGSRVFLDWHTEDAFHMLRPDFLGLLCLRSDPAAATTFASIKRMTIPDEYKRCLFEERFQAGIDKAHGGSGRAEEGPKISILSGRYDDPYIRVDTSCIRALPGDIQAAAALAYVIRQMSAVARQFIMQPGDVLFIDNQCTVHGRTAFQPRFDGTDRWLQRVIIGSDFRKSYVARRQRLRIIEPDQRFIR